MMEVIRLKKAKSKYSHANHIDHHQGCFEVNCYGFVNSLLLSEYLGNALEEVQQFIKISKHIPPPLDNTPCPLHYVYFIKSQTAKKHWTTVQNARHLQPGDIIAYTSKQKNINPNSPKPKPESGQHIMIVANPVKPIFGTGWFFVPIFDSTRYKHGKFDIRGHEGGIGQGFIALNCNERGEPRYIKWSIDSRFMLERDIVMARLK